MEINELLQGIECVCGRMHRCDIHYVAIGSNAISQLGDIVKEYSNILLVADENTYTAAGEKTENALSGKCFDKVIFSGKTVLIPNEEAIDRVMQDIEGIDLIIGIGSGVIQDLCKYVSNTTGIPYYIVATAPSMDGYASTGAAMILGGMKVTVSAGVPAAIIADTQVLKDAPMEMIQAGYGDIVGKYSALNDWRLSQVVNDEYFCQEIYDLTMDMVHKTLELADGVNWMVMANETGKSTWAAFLAAMFYGLDPKRAGKNRLSDKERYEPWSGRAMEGMVELEFEGLWEWQIKENESDMTDTTLMFDEKKRIIWSDDQYVNMEELKKGSYAIAQSMKWRFVEL
jgi:hypothetical protein